MIKFLSVSVITSGLLALSVAVPAQAQTATRAWVSGHGTDAAGCGAVANPCRSLQYTHDNIIANGADIDILDPAGYGAVTISKSVNIINDGVGTAGLQATSGANGITVNAGSNGPVLLRGLSIDGFGTGGVGILVNSGSGVDIVNCTIGRFAGAGISIAPSSGLIQSAIVNDYIADNGGTGISFNASGTAGISSIINQANVVGNGAGITLNNSGSGTVSLTLFQSVVAKSSGNGIAALSTGTQMTIGSSASAGNNVGVYIASGAYVGSFGDNEFFANMTPVSGSLSTISRQ